MSQENVGVGEPVRRLWAALNKREWDAFSAELDPDVEYAPVEEQVVYRGPEAATRYAKRWLEAWDTSRAASPEPRAGRGLLWQSQESSDEKWA